MPLSTPVFDLPDRLARKADPALISVDEQHFTALATTLESSITGLIDRIDRLRRMPGGAGQESMDRDIEIHQLTARLRTLRRYGLDACLGRLVHAGDPAPVYIGRFGLTDDEGRRLLLDWRSPAAEPFFGATHADPMGLTSRRRYRWTRGRISDYWDEVFTPDAFDGNAALDDQSAFIASLGSSRSSRMRDVLATIQADQDAVIRAGARGALVVDGGPGTGKTVVALHRTAYLLYSDPRLGHRRGGVLFIGPSAGYLAYVDDVLPSLGEEGVQIATLRDLVAEGVAAGAEPDPEVARLKASASTRLDEAIERAVRCHETAPTLALSIATPWADVRLGADDWAEAFDARDPGTPHNEAREEVWEELLAILIDRHDDEVAATALRRALERDEELRAAFSQAWPVLDPAGVVADLLSNPNYLQRCAPWLSDTEIGALQRADARAWTTADLPLLDAARQRIGDPEEVRQRRRRAAALAAEEQSRASVIDDLIASDDSEMLVMSMLRGQDARNSLIDEAALPSIDPDQLAGPFAHVVVDEAQELTDAEWRMLLRRCPSRSFTIVGDRAQARNGFAESWTDRLKRIGLGQVTVASLTVNYRTPEEVMEVAAPEIRAVLPDANVPMSIRRSGLPVEYAEVSALPEILSDWLAANDEGVACVVAAGGSEGAGSAIPASPRIRSLTPELTKGLEFDLVVLLDPDAFGTGIEGAVDRYVAMTRATQQLVVLTTPNR
jgi:DNA helicase IV